MINNITEDNTCAVLPIHRAPIHCNNNSNLLMFKLVGKQEKAALNQNNNVCRLALHLYGLCDAFKLHFGTMFLANSIPKCYCNSEASDNSQVTIVRQVTIVK